MSAGRDAPTSRVAGSLAALDAATVWLERPVRRLSGPHRLNPLPHAGTISVVLLGVVVGTGLYITLFFEFGYDASYRSVVGLEDHPIQRVMRAAHRYSSAALVLTTVVHAWRIFVAARFSGGRRWLRWLTGLSALVLVWLAGVTGYWLVWDVRAQALNEATNAVIGRWGWGSRLVVRGLHGSGSGSDTLLVLWLAHLGLTAAIGWFVFRHLRRTRMAVLPPRHWLIIMGATLVAVSVVLPVGVLAPADPGRALPDMPLDPFVLFLLPLLLSPTPWLWLAVGAVALALVAWLPRRLGRSAPPVVVIDADACTGCELCVVDCPYEALSMWPRDEGRPLAVLDASACVACGICIGACAFDAISFPDTVPLRDDDSDGQAATVLIVCDRHDRREIDAVAAEHDDVEVQSLRCAGMLSPAAIAHHYQRGATNVSVIGCAPGDCRFGVGNQRAAERLGGRRAPHLPRRWSGLVAEDWVAVGEVHRAMAEPGAQPDATTSATGTDRRSFVGAGALVVLSVVAVSLATRAPFRAGGDEAGLRVVVDHEAGRPLIVQPEQPVGAIRAIEVELADGTIDRRAVPTSSGVDVALLDWAIAADDGDAAVAVRAVTDTETLQLAAPSGPVEPGERLVIELSDVPRPVGAADGERLFNARVTGCAVCHSVEADDDGVGPSLAGVASVAGDRVEGLTDEQYLRQSILLPDQYVVDGWPAGQMLPFYRDDLSESDLDALVAYLLTLTEDDS